MIVCPFCERNDQLMKVSSIVDYGTHKISGQTETWKSGDYSILSGEYDGGHWESVPISGIQRSELARKLALPEHPTKPSITFGTCFNFVLLFTIFPTVVSLFGLFVSWGTGKYQQTVSSIALRVAIGIPVVCLIIYIVWFIVGRLKYSEEKPIWDRAWHVWNRLYFCFRDNKVYDPETGATLDPHNINKFIFNVRS